MSMTLGRCTITSDPNLGSFRADGDRVAFSFYIYGVAQAGTALDDMKAKIQQLRGMVDNEDEDVFPVTISTDATFDGFYDQFQISIADTPLMYTDAICLVSVSMRRIAGAAAAQFENTATVVLQTTAFALPSTLPNWQALLAVPFTDLQSVTAVRNVLAAGASAYGHWVISGTNCFSRTTDDGLVLCSTVANPWGTGAAGAGAAGTARWYWSTTPALFYEGSARIEQSYGGAYYPVVGQQILKSSNAWRVSNGLVRVSLSATTIDVAHYDGAQWDTVKSWVLGSAGGNAGSVVLSAIKSVRVLRNTPQNVVVRAIIQMASSGRLRNLDISLRRGCRWAGFVLQSDNIETGQWYIENNEAATAITGGLRATSTDASGNKYVVGSPTAQTNTTGTGRLKITTATANPWPFCIGSAVGADGSEATVIDQFVLATSEDQRVIAR